MSFNFDTAEYLKRINYKISPKISVLALNELIKAHLVSVPFENLDIFDFRRNISIEPEQLYNKIVLNHRGGYCFELNGLFYLLLKQLGFEGYPIAMRVVWRQDTLPMLSHRATVITLDSKKWFCDVGFGGPGPKGVLCLTSKEPQKISDASFLVKHENNTFTICREELDDWVGVLSFKDEPFEEIDFNLLNEYSSKREEAYFAKQRMANICHNDGYISLKNNQLTVVKNGVSENLILNNTEQINHALQTYFGIFEPIS